MKRTMALACAMAIAAAAAPRSDVDAAARELVVDRGASLAVIAVGKSGALSFMAGHTHEVTAPIDGTVEIDTADLARSRVQLDIDATALKVTGKGDPPDDVPKVQRVMVSDTVLDVARYPTIAFRSTSITVKSQTGKTADLVIAGTLTLHGVSRPVSIPAHADIADTAVNAKGAFAIKQTDFGMKPVSVAGVVTVKDALAITFTIAAHQR